jgi:arginyl-tRNA synthetase
MSTTPSVPSASSQPTADRPEPQSHQAENQLPALPLVEGSDPARCTLELFRTAIAQRLVAAFPSLTLEAAYAGVDYGKKGEDFTVALPRFRLGGKVDELAKKVLDQVRVTFV